MFFVLYILALEPDLLRTKTSFEKNICVVRSVTKGYQSYVKLIFYVDAYCDKITCKNSCIQIQIQFKFKFMQK